MPVDLLSSLPFSLSVTHEVLQRAGERWRLLPRPPPFSVHFTDVLSINTKTSKAICFCITLPTLHSSGIAFRFFTQNWMRSKWGPFRVHWDGLAERYRSRTIFRISYWCLYTISSIRCTGCVCIRVCKCVSAYGELCWGEGHIAFTYILWCSNLVP